MQNKNFYIGKIFIVLLIIVFIQSFLQNPTELQGILSTIIGYLVPFIYALFFAIILHPLSSLIESKFSIKRTYCISIAVLIFLLAILAIILGIIPGLTESIKQVHEKLPSSQAKFELHSERLIAFLENRGISLLDSDNVKEFTNGFFSKNATLIRGLITSLSLNILNFLIVLGQLLLGLFLAVFLISDREYFENLLSNILFLFFDKKRANSSLELLKESRVIFLNYLLGQFLVSLSVAAIVFALTFIGGVPYSLLISILIIFANMIPYVGMFVILVLGTFFVGIEDPSKLWILYASITAANQIEAFYLSPKIIGKTVGLNSFWVITGVLLGGASMGTIGMILGVPIIGIIRLIYRNSFKNKLSHSAELENGGEICEGNYYNDIIDKTITPDIINSSSDENINNNVNKKDSKDNKDSKDDKDSKDSKDRKNNKDNKDNKDNKSKKDNKDKKNSKNNKKS